ncbi:MAG TPA: serine--tRNA ligase, partial [Planctomycetota bacterium]|nr:serine--tRNA ligase [Planctomycetota bacterium]
MLDPRFFRENPELVRDACKRKRIEADVDGTLALDVRARELKSAFDLKKAEQNRRSKEIPSLKGDERAAALAEMKELSGAAKDLEVLLKD